MASSEGGMDIEEVAAKTPEKIHKVFIDPLRGLTDAEADDVARKIGVPEASLAQARAVLHGLYRAFDETDASLAEINPLVVTGDGSVIALDAKLNFDANALFRHPEIVEMRDLDEEDPAEIEASQVRPVLHLARRQHRLPRQRRGPRDGDDGHHQALRRRAGELPRRRRRRDGREGDRGVQDHAAQPEPQGDPRQHLRRHHEVRHDRTGGVVAASRGLSSRCRWSCA